MAWPSTKVSNMMHGESNFNESYHATLNELREGKKMHPSPISQCHTHPFHKEIKHALKNNKVQ